MAYLLAVHIFLGLTVLIVFIARYAAVLMRKLHPDRGQRLLLWLSGLLLLSGVLLMAVAHETITNACLAALGIIATVVVLELALQKLGQKVFAD